jgi:hypothetical protein
LLDLHGLSYVGDNIRLVEIDKDEYGEPGLGVFSAGMAEGI